MNILKKIKNEHNTVILYNTLLPTVNKKLLKVIVKFIVKYKEYIQPDKLNIVNTIYNYSNNYKIINKNNTYIRIKCTEQKLKQNEYATFDDCRKVNTLIQTPKSFLHDSKNQKD